MRNYHIFLTLLLITSPIYCYTEVDNVTINITTLSEQLTQDALKNGTTEAEEWGVDSLECYSCSNLSNKYFCTIDNIFTLTKTFTGIKTHDYIYIILDAVFLNVEKKTGGNAKNAKINIDVTAQTFSANVVNDDYGCMSHVSSRVDGKTSVALLFTHSSSTMTVKIASTDLGIYSKLGIANLKIVQVDCSFIKQMCMQYWIQINIKNKKQSWKYIY